MANQSLPDILDIKIRSRDKVVFEGQAVHLTSNNSVGSFTILPRHTNFISIIKDFIQIRKPDQTEEKIKVEETGILKVLENRVEVYLGLTAPPTPPPHAPTPSKSK